MLQELPVPPVFAVVGMDVRVEMDPVHIHYYRMHLSLGEVLTARWHQGRGAKKGPKVILTNILSKSRTCCGCSKETNLFSKQ